MEGLKSPSKRKIDANRQNGKKGKGPVTVNGIAISRYNAVAHGIFAQAIIIPGREDREKQRDFDVLHHQLRDDLLPVGIQEEIIVEKMACLLWRQRRLLWAEAGEARRAEGVGVLAIYEPLSSPQSVDLQQGREEEIPSAWSKGTKTFVVLNQKLLAIRREVENTGQLSEASRSYLEITYGTDSSFFSTGKSATRSDQVNPKINMYKKNCQSDQSSGSQKETLLGDIDRLRETQDWELARHIKLLKDIETTRRSIPLGQSSETILRYDAALEKQYYRAMQMLKILQDERRARKSLSLNM
jgi:hypothetical protein